MAINFMYSRSEWGYKQRDANLKSLRWTSAHLGINVWDEEKWCKMTHISVESIVFGTVEINTGAPDVD